MKELSHPNHVVPKLSIDGASLTPEALSRIDTKQIARPASLLAKIYWDIVEILDDMLDLLDALNDSGEASSRKHRAALRHAELMMLRCTSLNDYLRKLLAACAPENGKKDLDQCCNAIEARLGRSIKVPLNKIKHDGFTLALIMLTNGVASVPGFVVYGPLPDGAAGPLARSAKHGAGTSEGYSLPLFMRRVLALVFEMSDLARDQLLKWGAINKPLDAAEAHNPNDVRIKSLPATLERLNALPVHGFKGEEQTRSPVFQIQDGTLTMQQIRTKSLKGTVRVHFELPAVQAGSSFYMPYWKNQR